MPVYRIYAPVPDAYGATNVQRVGLRYKSLARALKACESASMAYGVAELRDEARSIYDRMLYAFRGGSKVVER